MPRRFPVAIFLFAFAGWTFDFYDLVLLGFLKDSVGRDLHLSHTAESWLLGAGLGASGVGGLVAGRSPTGSASGRFSRSPCWSTRWARWSAAWPRAERSSSPAA